MKHPCHPGEIIREDVLAPLGLNVTQAAKVLCVTRQALSNMLNGRTSLTAGLCASKRRLGLRWIISCGCS